MKIIEISQGSKEWLAHRAACWNASDAPAMMGVSPYETRDQLIARLATGIEPEVDAATQALFDRGHKNEAYARPLAQEILGETLYPVVGVADDAVIGGRMLSASFDGLTMDESIGWECKTLNAALREAMPAVLTENHVELPAQYRVQLDHQCLVSGALKVLFTATDGTETRHAWYVSNAAKMHGILMGWEQLAKDIAAYVTPEPKLAVIVESFVLPAPALAVSGALTVSGNLTEHHALVKAYIDRLPKRPETDQDFATLDRACKDLKDAETKLAAAEANALAQTASIEEMRRQVATIQGLMRDSRLAFEKLVKTGKDERKAAIIQVARKALHEHEEPLQELSRHHLPVTPADWLGVTRGLKTLDSFQSKVNDELARCKVLATQTAHAINTNLGLLDAAGMMSLFPDVGQLVLKSPDDLKATIALRKAQHEADALKAREREAAAALERQQREESVALRVPASVPTVVQANTERVAAALTKAARPTDDQIIGVLSQHYRVHESKAIEWLLAMNLKAASDRMMTEFF